MSPLRIAFLGTGDFAVPALRALADGPHTVSVVFSQPDRPTGRGLAVRPTPVRACAVELGLFHIQVEDINAASVHAQLLDMPGGPPDLGVVAAFGQKLSPATLGLLPRGFVNVHASLLPRYRGAAPFQWAILNGDAQTGVTVFQLNERWDAGPILGQRSTTIGETETADELHDRLAAIGAELLSDTLGKLARGESTPLPQDPTLASRAPKLSKADSALDWNRAAAQIIHSIHGLWSWPGARSRFVSRTGRTEEVRLARARVANATEPASPQFPPGAVRPDGAIQCGVGAIRVLELQPAGGKVISFDAFANGRRLGVGDRFE